MLFPLQTLGVVTLEGVTGLRVAVALLGTPCVAARPERGGEPRLVTRPEVLASLLLAVRLRRPTSLLGETGDGRSPPAPPYRGEEKGGAPQSESLRRLRDEGLPLLRTVGTPRRRSGAAPWRDVTSLCVVSWRDDGVVSLLLAVETALPSGGREGARPPAAVLLHNGITEVVKRGVSPRPPPLGRLGPRRATLLVRRADTLAHAEETGMRRRGVRPLLQPVPREETSSLVTVLSDAPPPSRPEAAAPITGEATSQRTVQEMGASPTPDVSPQLATESLLPPPARDGLQMVSESHGVGGFRPVTAVCRVRIPLSRPLPAEHSTLR